MATIARRDTADGRRYDVRWRVNGEQRKRTFRLARDAENFKRKVESDETAGLVIDPRGGETLFGAYAATWLDTRLVRGRPLTAMDPAGLRRPSPPPCAADVPHHEAAGLSLRTRCGRGTPPQSTPPAPTRRRRATRVLRAILNTRRRRRLDRAEPVQDQRSRARACCRASHPRHGNRVAARRCDRAAAPGPRARRRVPDPPTWRAVGITAPGRRPIARHPPSGAPGARGDRPRPHRDGPPKSDAGTRTLSLPAPIAQGVERAPGGLRGTGGRCVGVHETLRTSASSPGPVERLEGKRALSWVSPERIRTI